MDAHEHGSHTITGPPPTISRQRGSRPTGCWTYVAIGCVVLVVLAVIAGVFTYIGVSRFVGGVLEEYTDVAPAEMPFAEAPAGDETAVAERVESFVAAIRRGESPPPLLLSAEDVNLVIHHDPEWQALAGKAHVAIDGDRITARAAVPLDDLGWVFKGRYLNGTFAFRLELVAGRLAIFVESVDVGGRPLPEELMSALRARNLAEAANQDPDVRQALEGIGSISVRDGHIVIEPKGAGDSPAATPARTRRLGATYRSPVGSSA